MVFALQFSEVHLSTLICAPSAVMFLVTMETRGDIVVGCQSSLSSDWTDALASKHAGDLTRLIRTVQVNAALCENNTRNNTAASDDVILSEFDFYVGHSGMCIVQSLFHSYLMFFFFLSLKLMCVKMCSRTVPRTAQVNVIWL